MLSPTKENQGRPRRFKLPLAQAALPRLLLLSVC